MKKTILQSRFVTSVLTAQLLAQMTLARGNLGHRMFGTLIGCSTKIKQSIHLDQGYFDRERNGLSKCSSNDSKEILIFFIMPKLFLLKQKHAEITPVSARYLYATAAEATCSGANVI